MRVVLSVFLLDYRDKLDRYDPGPLMEQLEHRVLRIGPDPTPCNRSGFSSDRRTLGAD